MQLKNKMICLTLIGMYVFYIGLVFDVSYGNDFIEPSTNNGRKWRIGYCESESYFNYTATLLAIIKGLDNIGWLSLDIEGDDIGDNSQMIWAWLANENLGPYLEFVDDAYYSLGDHDSTIEEKIINRLNKEKDLDLMIVMGTYAGKVLANGDHSIPTMVFSSSNAVQSGIIQSKYDSGLDHVWAHMDSDRYRRQIEVFYNIIHFKKVGIVYEDTFNGRTYAALDDLKALSKELGYEIVSYIVPEARDSEDMTRYHRDLLEAYQKLASQVDAMYLTAGTRDIDQLSQLLNPFYEAGIPVFSQMGAEEVQHGALFSIYRANYMGIGRFGADSIAKVLDGQKPRQLTQIYGDTPSIVFNMAVARKIAYKVPFEILLSADVIYQEIQGE